MDLVTNSDQRLSTTATVQFIGFIALSLVLLASVYYDRSYVPELFTSFAMYCGGLVVTKGAVGAYATSRAIPHVVDEELDSLQKQNLKLDIEKKGLELVLNHVGKVLKAEGK